MKRKDADCAKMYEHIFNLIGDGIIAINSMGIISAYNRTAQAIFGLILDSEQGHPTGQLNPNDWVILADTGLGEDDGDLNAADLRRIGIDSCPLKSGDAFVAYGRYGASTGGTLIAVPDKKGNFERTFMVDGVDLHIRVDFAHHLTEIAIGSASFSMPYVWSVGHMVALDGSTGRVKFFQAKGYTYRREDLKRLLAGEPYRAKGLDGAKEILVGRHIYEIHPPDSNPDIVSFCHAAERGTGEYRKEIKEINGRMTRCSLSIWNGQAILQIEDITELDALKKERDFAVEALEQQKGSGGAPGNFARIIGRSAAMERVRIIAQKASKSESNVLLLGESGTGKGLFAECIHLESRRAAGPYIYVNCASIPHELLESELFGYEGGAFTGARKEGKPGMFELADRGTLFLDEIGELPMTLQVKLLHAVQDRRFMRVGGTQPVPVDIRIICATNQDLEEAVRLHRFRSDLYYRINVLPIRIPPLRERPEDLTELIASRVPEICTRAGVPEKSLSPGAKRLIYRYDWPGNVRELENVLERAINLADHLEIQPEHLGISAVESAESASSCPQALAKAVENAERAAIRAALEQAGGNRSKAMEILEIRKTVFYEKIKQYQLR